MRMILRRSLESAHYEVVEAKDGEEALGFLRHTTFDLLTLDIDMPGINGFEVCAELRKLEHGHARLHTPVILVTSHDTVADRQRGFEVGATDFISKPFQEAELLSRIERLLKAEQRLIGLTALVADDSPVSRKVVSYWLKENGLKVLEAENGEQALQLLQSTEQEIDILITDYDMPVMDGKELCRRVRASLGKPWLPVIFLSGLADKSYILDMFAAGATDYIVKPFAKEELTARIAVHVEIRNMVRERAKRIEELERLNQLKNSLLAIASHDLRSPLNGIIGCAEIMLLEEDLQAKHRDYAEMIRDSGNWLLSMINDLLDLARIEAEQTQLKLQPMDLTETIQTALKSLYPLAKAKNITLASSPEATSTPVLIRGDRDSVLRIVGNLVSNAIKFTETGGCVTVTAADATLTVIDTGIGIPEDKLPLLFDRFSRSSRRGTAGEPSTGLGMAITKSLVELHRGQIKVTSKVNYGTKIVVSFQGANA
ncbi:MAG: response regulator [Opitutae bacterium]|nr:response regulator [Opitutae bacterium]